MCWKFIYYLILFSLSGAFSCQGKFVVDEMSGNQSGSLANKSQNNCTQTNSGLDLCFNETGRIQIPNAYEGVGGSRIISSGDSIYHVGVHEDISSNSFVVVQKFSLNGELDTTYGNSGLSEIPELEDGIDENAIQLHKLIIDQNDNLYISGRFPQAAVYRGFIIKMKPDGTLDENFDDGSACVSTGGCILVNLDPGMSNYEQFVDLYLDGDNLFGLYSLNTMNDYYQLRKYSAVTGQLSVGFGPLSDGVLEVSDAGKNYNAIKFYFDVSNNHIYVFGEYEAFGENELLFVNRILLNTGILDTTYNSSGLIKLDLPDEGGIDDLIVYDVHNVGDGTAYALIDGMIGSKEYIYLHRFNYITGQNDITFDSDGFKVINSVAPGGNVGDANYRNLLFDNQNFYICGFATEVAFTNTFAVSKLDSTGELIPTWEDNSKFYPDLSLIGNCENIAIDLNGGIYATGTLASGFSSITNLYKFVP